MRNLQSTIGNKEWLKINEAALKAMLPKTWTHMHNLDPVMIGYKLKLIGVDWRISQSVSSRMLGEKLSRILKSAAF